jgi:hypothetical protein
MRRALEAFDAQDLEAFVGYMDPDIEFEPHLALVEGRYRGTTESGSSLPMGLRSSSCVERL